MKDTDIPLAARKAVDERDQKFCRVCGKYLGDRRAIHHIRFGFGTGARRVHELDNMLTVCWLPGDNGCHERLHSDKQKWMPFAIQAATTTGVTVLQLERWSRSASTGRVHPLSRLAR